MNHATTNPCVNVVGTSGVLSVFSLQSVAVELVASTSGKAPSADSSESSAFHDFMLQTRFLH